MYYIPEEDTKKAALLFATSGLYYQTHVVITLNHDNFGFSIIYKSIKFIIALKI